jgi:ABC-type nitrate/sulfonate/bicarbonate transport system substrate-binding protein
VGETLGPVVFSSLTATQEWFQKPEATRFMRTYRKAREWVNTASAVEIARAEQGVFPDVDQGVLTQMIAYYHTIPLRTRRRGGAAAQCNGILSIMRAALRRRYVFLHDG